VRDVEVLQRWTDVTVQVRKKLGLLRGWEPDSAFDLEEQAPCPFERAILVLRCGAASPRTESKCQHQGDRSHTHIV
jgi:hypothetical protein